MIGLDTCNGRTSELFASGDFGGVTDKSELPNTEASDGQNCKGEGSNSDQRLPGEGSSCFSSLHLEWSSGHRDAFLDVDEFGDRLEDTDGQESDDAATDGQEDRLDEIQEGFSIRLQCQF